MNILIEDSVPRFADYSKDYSNKMQIVVRGSNKRKGHSRVSLVRDRYHNDVWSSFKCSDALFVSYFVRSIHHATKPPVIETVYCENVYHALLNNLLNNLNNLLKFPKKIFPKNLLQLR